MKKCKERGEKKKKEKVGKKGNRKKKICMYPKLSFRPLISSSLCSIPSGKKTRNAVDLLASAVFTASRIFSGETVTPILS